MQKRYLVKLSQAEQDELREVIKRLSGSGQKVRRAQILLKANMNGANWTDAQIAGAFECRTKTVENIRQRLVEQGFESTLNGAKRENPPTAKRLDGGWFKKGRFKVTLTAQSRASSAMLYVADCVSFYAFWNR
ncbi:MAG: Homeodomain-like domain [Phormidesmis priestleyi Ana]|uniref:Homeodomain-like domain n=1 Tax=Phormidesmis priestleyi Ana TaxID=1666911 RepID=A0A0P7ZPX2_9CYAN|nr:MAG: Homeodomain-like domain [Phormidesmis priestleyi Ana]